MRPANFTWGPDVTLNIEKKQKTVRIKAPYSVNASKRKHKNQIHHYDKQRQVLMTNSTVGQRLITQSMHQSENIKIKLITMINKDEYS